VSQYSAETHDLQFLQRALFLAGWAIPSLVVGLSVFLCNQTGKMFSMNSASRLDWLKVRYRALWDAHQSIAQQNAGLLKAGVQPTAEQLVSEQRAAEDLRVARQELLAAVAGLGK
jgi:hypothetical protein